jgi:hypothetical protein
MKDGSSKSVGDASLITSGRASNLIISGINEVRKFLDLFNKAEARMHGIQWVDLHIMRAVLSIIEENRHNSLEGRLEIIDLKFHMHVDSEEEAAKRIGGLSRVSWEKRHKSVPGSSYKKAISTIKLIYENYKRHQQSWADQKAVNH